MQKLKREIKGITLVALVVTIIVLLILAGIAINLSIGNNGLFTRAKDVQIKMDIEETKELIKLEIMGEINEDGNYTNADVVKAVEKVTGKIVEEGAEVVISRKENEVPISDLWKVEFAIYFPKVWNGGNVKIVYKEGQVWNQEFLESIVEVTELDKFRDIMVQKPLIRKRDTV